MLFLRNLCCFLLCCVFEVSVARRTEEAESLEKMESARCVSRCLTLHITQITAAFRHLQNDHVLGWCENHRRCSQCLQPCKELWETRRALSPKTCEKHNECVTSAEFLRSLRVQKQGDCPPAQRASGFAAACVESCVRDRECSGLKKCCSNGCGHTCQSPANLFKGVPLKPRRDISFSEDQQGHLKVTWMSKFNVSVEPVLYVLQRRWNHGIHPSEDEASAWQTVLMTMEDRSVLKDIRPHRWYQFRVSAVNSQGTRGFTTPSKHFFSVRDPLPPETPQNARTGNQTLHPDGTVSVLVLWETPSESDLVVHHYKVTWSPRGTPSSSQSRAGRVTDGDVTEMELQGLQPNTPYTAQIQAISYWGQNRLKSSRAHVSFTTTSQNSATFSNGEFSNELPISHSSPSVLRLEAAAPHYHDNQLQVKVFWKSRVQESQKDSSSYILRWYPEVCSHNVTKDEKTATVQGTHFVITGLLFACKYRVAVKPITEQRSEVTTSVTTPLCLSLMGRRKKPAACAREERHPQLKKTLRRPEKLAVLFQPVNGSLQALFSWQVSPESSGQTPGTGFQFSWVKVSSGSSSNGSLISQTHVLPPDQMSLTVDALQPSSVYRVQVQVLSEAGNGPSVAKTLHTPALNTTIH
ncbi:anosmin-1b [Danio aesculapii]|uniref:anosmin-1b n=1 Tax=Danio aesculapii TaxID=1142201 RepID=UPI0024C03167|nr:anosmin-1b [Danio aesculapii]